MTEKRTEQQQIGAEIQAIIEARRAQMAPPVMRATALLSGVKPSIWKDVEEFRAGRSRKCFSALRKTENESKALCRSGNQV